MVLCGCDSAEAPDPAPEVSEAARASSEFLPYYDNPQFDPHWLGGDSAKLEHFHAIPDFVLTNQHNQTVTAQTFEGKIYITDFFFTTCPTVCPKMMDAMGKLQETFADDEDVMFLSHSVTPEVDTPEVLEQYAERYGVVSGKWHLVTGDRSLIYSLGRDHYFVEEDLGKQKTENDFLHTDNFLLIDKNRHIRGIYSGLSRSDMRRLVADVATLQNEPE